MLEVKVFVTLSWPWVWNNTLVVTFGPSIRGPDFGVVLISVVDYTKFAVPELKNKSDLDMVDDWDLEVNTVLKTAVPRNPPPKRQAQVPRSTIHQPATSRDHGRKIPQNTYRKASGNMVIFRKADIPWKVDSSSESSSATAAKPLHQMEPPKGEKLGVCCDVLMHLSCNISQIIFYEWRNNECTINSYKLSFLGFGSPSDDRIKLLSHMFHDS